MKNFIKNYLAWLLLIAAVIVIAALLINNSGNNDTVAKVGDEKITRNELYERLVGRYGAEMLDAMITDKIIEAETIKQNINITDAEIQEEMDRMIEAYGGQEVFSQQLAQYGLAIEDMEKDIISYLKTIKLLEPRINITEEEIASFFEENKFMFDKPELVKASHILVKDKATAEEVKRQLDEGGDFAALAAKYSTDESNAQKGGDLDFFGRGEMVEEFETAAFSMKVNEISEPVKTDYGYHIIKVTDRREAQEASLEDSRAEIEKTLKNEKANAEYSSWLAEKKEEYNIDNSLGY